MKPCHRVLSLVTLIAAGASAQQGGILIGTNFGGDPTNMNPLISNNTVELALNEFLFPSLYNYDPETRAPMRAVATIRTTVLPWIGAYPKTA